jgi:hypothetical protein
VAHPTELPTFTAVEQGRLAVYKVAMAVGFYTDTASEQSERYRFTTDELARLVVYKAAIAMGFYTDQLDDDDLEA